MKKVKQYLIESYEELRYKVFWPKYSDLQSSSILVLVASLIFAMVIGLIDLAFDQVLTWYYSAF